MGRPGLWWAVVGVSITVIGRAVFDGWTGIVISLAGAFVTLFGAFVVWRSRQSEQT